MLGTGLIVKIIGAAFGILGLLYVYSVLRDLLPSLRFTTKGSTLREGIERVSEMRASEVQMVEKLERRFMEVSFELIRSRRIGPDMVVFLTRNVGGVAAEATVWANAPIDVHLSPADIEPDDEVQFTCSNVPPECGLISFEMKYTDCAGAPADVSFGFDLE